MDTGQRARPFARFTAPTAKRSLVGSVAGQPAMGFPDHSTEVVFAGQPPRGGPARRLLPGSIGSRGERAPLAAKGRKTRLGRRGMGLFETTLAEITDASCTMSSPAVRSGERTAVARRTPSEGFTDGCGSGLLRPKTSPINPARRKTTIGRSRPASTGELNLVAVAAGEAAHFARTRPSDQGKEKGRRLCVPDLERSPNACRRTTDRQGAGGKDQTRRSDE